MVRGTAATSCARLGIGATLSEPTLPGARSVGPARPYVRGASLGGEGRMHVGHCAAGVPHVLLLPTTPCGGLGGQLG